MTNEEETLDQQWRRRKEEAILEAVERALDPIGNDPGGPPGYSPQRVAEGVLAGLRAAGVL